MEFLFAPLVLKILVGFGLLLYCSSTLLCSYLALFTILTNIAHWQSKVKIYYGYFSLALWASIIVAVVIIKIGSLLLL